MRLAVVPPSTELGSPESPQSGTNGPPLSGVRLFPLADPVSRNPSLSCDNHVAAQPAAHSGTAFSKEALSCLKGDAQLSSYQGCPDVMPLIYPGKSGLVLNICLEPALFEKGQLHVVSYLTTGADFRLWAPSGAD